MDAAVTGEVETPGVKFGDNNYLLTEVKLAETDDIEAYIKANHPGGVLADWKDLKAVSATKFDTIEFLDKVGWKLGIDEGVHIFLNGQRTA
jgi:hypothetical protein